MAYTKLKQDIERLKHQPQELPCCEDCEHKGKTKEYCVIEEICPDVLIHNVLLINYLI